MNICISDRCRLFGLLWLVAFLAPLVSAGTVFAQGACSAPADNEYYYSESGAFSPSADRPIITRVAKSELEMTAGGSVESAPPGVTVSVGMDGDSVSAMAYDMRGDVFYYAIRPLFSGFPTLFATRLPLESNTPEVVATFDGVIIGIAIDWTNRDKVYVVTDDNIDGSEREIFSFDRTDMVPSGVTPVSVSQQATNVTPLGLVHIPSATDGDDKLFIVEQGNAGPELKGFDIGPDGNVSLDGSAVDVIEPSDPIESDFEFMALDRTTDQLYLTLFDSAAGQLVLKKIGLPAAASFTSNEVFSTFDVPTGMGPNCSTFTLGVSSVANALPELFLNCNTYFGEPTSGIAVFQDISSELVALTEYTNGVTDSEFAKPAGGFAVQCCSASSDRDTDGDTFVDCLDPDPLDPLIPEPPVEEDPDSDGDGVADMIDQCPDMAASVEDQQLEGLPLGCPCMDRADADFDGLLNCQEPANTRLIPVGGMCQDERDGDRDGTQNCFDPCPDDANKIEPLICGCGIAETPDCLVACKEGFVDLGCGCGIDDCSNLEGRVVLTNGTIITMPPQVQLVGNLDRARKNVRVTLQSFDLGRRIRRSARQTLAAVRAAGEGPALLGMRRRTKRLQVAYDVQLRVARGNRFARSARRQTRKAELVFRNLPPGVYSTRYRAITRRRVRDDDRRKFATVTRTQFSPSTTFSIS